MSADSCPASVFILISQPSPPRVAVIVTPLKVCGIEIVEPVLRERNGGWDVMGSLRKILQDPCVGSTK